MTTKLFTKMNKVMIFFHKFGITAPHQRWLDLQLTVQKKAPSNFLIWAGSSALYIFKLCVSRPSSNNQYFWAYIIIKRKKMIIKKTWPSVHKWFKKCIICIT